MHPYLKANICPSIDGKINFLRTRLREGYKIRVHSTLEQQPNTMNSLQSTATPYMGNRQVGTYDPFSEKNGNIPSEATQACRGSVPYIQLPLEYLRKYGFEEPVGQFTTGYLTIEKEDITIKPIK